MVNPKKPFGLTGNTGVFSDKDGSFVHINAPYVSDGKVFVTLKSEPMSWRRVTPKEAKRRKMSVIKCSYCKRAAVRIDHSWPYLTGTTSCNNHLNRHDAD